MRQAFCILSVSGDVLDGGELDFIETAQSLDAAKARVQSLAESQPGKYVIYNENTGETFSAGISEQCATRVSYRLSR